MGNKSDSAKHFIRLERGFWAVIGSVFVVLVFALLRHVVFALSNGAINPSLWKFAVGSVLSVVLLVVLLYAIGYFLWDFWIDVAAWLDLDEDN